MGENGLDKRWLELGGAAGIMAAVLELGAGVAGGSSPAGDAPTATIAAYLQAHRNGVLTQTVLTVAGLAFTLWFMATVARVIQARDPRSPLGLIVLASGTALVGVVVFDGLSLTALEMLTTADGPANPAVIRTLYKLENGIVAPGALGFVVAVFLAALGVAILRRTFAAAWVGWVCLGFAPLSVLSGTVGLTLRNGGLTPFSFFAVIGLGIATVLCGVFLIRDGQTQPAATGR